MGTDIVAGRELFTAEHLAFRDSVRRFVKEQLDPNAAAWNAAGIIPRDAWKQMGAMGFFGTGYEEKYGGSNVDLLYSVILAEELAKTKVSGLCLSICDHKDMSSNYILHGTEEIRQRYLPGCISGDLICGVAITEPSGGSDVAGLKTTAKPDGDHYVVSGQKAFITNGISADIMVVAARTAPSTSRSRDGLSLFVVETASPGFGRGAPLKKMGSVASDTAELYFDGLRIPAKNLLGTLHGGYSILMENLGLERLLGCAVYISACEEILAITTDYAKNRKIGGRAVTDFQVHAHRLAELYTKTALAKVFLYDTLARFMRRERVVKEVSMLKYYASELANEAAYVGVSMHGGWGYMKDFQICQWYTDVRLFNLGAGTSDVMKEVIAKEILGRTP